MNWIKQIIGVLGKKKSDLIAEPPHVLFQKDYYSIAWGLKHRGYYLTSEGTKYSYDKPSKWNFYEILNEDGAKEMSSGFDKISFIDGDKLLQNLGLCEISFTPSKSEHENLTSIIDELTNSELIETREGDIDAGLHSSSLLIFDNVSNSYKRLLLECHGDLHLELNSEKRMVIYRMFSPPPLTVHNLYNLAASATRD